MAEVYRGDRTIQPFTKHLLSSVDREIAAITTPNIYGFATHAKLFR